MQTSIDSRQAPAAGQRVTLVTGGTGGIGAAVAMRMAREGDRVPR